MLPIFKDYRKMLLDKDRIIKLLEEKNIDYKEI
jgi:hypothetical protein